MMSNDCARAIPPKPPSARLNMKTITTARRIKSSLFIPNPHGSRKNLLRCRRKPCTLTQAPRTTPYERPATLGWPLLGCRVRLAALCWQSLEPLAASNLCEESVESYASNVQEPRLPYTSTNGCLRRAPPGVTPVHCSFSVSARAKPEPCSEQFAERTHSPAKLRRCLASRQKALLEGWHVPTRAQLRAQGRSRALLQRRTRWLGRNPRGYGGLGRHEEGRDGIRQGAGGVARKGAHPGGCRTDYAARY